MPGYKYNSSAIAKTILGAGLLVGSLDIFAACADYYIETGKGPEGVLRFIASGVFGKTAFTGTTMMIWMGLLFHFMIAFAFTIIFFIVYPRIKLLQLSVVLAAVIFAIITWFIMNLIVVPLSNTPSLPFKFINALKAVLILICTIGFPLAIIFKNYYKPESKIVTALT
jgi:hypothetical protein